MDALEKDVIVGSTASSISEDNQEHPGVSLDFAMHSAQREIFQSPARFKVVAAGRRFGKSYLAAMTLLLEGMKMIHTGVSGRVYDVRLKEVYYIAPTFEQAKKIMWPLLKELGRDVIISTIENTATCTLASGRRVSIKGADRPDSLRGIGLSYVVLDEYAFMKEAVWDSIIRPALADVEGNALFIGTPDGKNHFYKLYTQATNKGLPEWSAFHYKSLDNPTLQSSEIESARNSISSELFRREFEASFTESSGAFFKSEWFQIVKECPGTGDYYITVDLAGFTQAGGDIKGKPVVRDDTAIAVVRVGTWGWYIENIVHGRWDVRETALQIMKAYKDYRPLALGIEKGALKNAVLPYLEDEMNRLNIHFSPIDLSHGGKAKLERIKWALQGRAEKGRVFLREDDSWNQKFIEQAVDFPSPLTHDDLIDAVAYVDQLATAIYFEDAFIDTHVVLDDITGI